MSGNLKYPKVTFDRLE
ncbi:hypothetical protein C349_04481 [Cryptococcus neoformans var. grubii Br795]|nr:hypothetical protein J007_04259 [Cryptococcus neoformans var. grubii]OXG79271.1 hypothetical protein C349_04481 [Cryptococcus neoformans var. grubii Br795]